MYVLNRTPTTLMKTRTKMMMRTRTMMSQRTNSMS